MNTVLKYGNDYDVDQWLAQMTGGTGGRPSESFIDSLNTFVAQLKLNGIWTELDRFWIFATEQQQHAKVCIKSLTTLTEVSSPNWLINSGYTSNLTTSYLNLNCAPSGLTKYQQNNASFGYYSLSDLDGNYAEMGFRQTTGTACFGLIRSRNAGNCVNAINTISTTPIAINDSFGMFSIERTASSLSKTYQRGTLITTDSSSVSATLPGTNFFGLCYNTDGSPTQLTPRRISSMFIGSANINQLTMHNLMQNFLLSRGTGMHPTLQIWYDNLTTKPSVPLLIKLNTLINNLSADGILSELDLFHVFGGLETDEQRLRPIITTATIKTFTNSGATLNYSGFSATSSNCVGTNWTPSIHSIKFTQNSASIGFYSMTDSQSANNDIGGVDASINVRMSVRSATDVTNIRINATSTSLAVGNTSSLGLFTAVRSASNLVTAYRNGVSLGSNAAVSTGLPSSEILLLTSSFIGNPSSGSNRLQGAAFIGSSNINQSTLYSRIQSYMISVGLGV